jgi:hypothetical protein
MIPALILTSVVAAGGDPAAVLDCAADVRRLDSHFARYGYQPARSIVRDGRGVRIRLPAGVTNVGQTGLYSYFALAGDFEVSAAYELADLPPPQAGYGISCGIAVDTQGPGGSVAVARGQAPKQPPGYVVTRGLPGDGGTKYETTYYPSSAKAGRLALRREKAEVVCLVADAPGQEVRELCRVPSVAGTVRQVRLFADPGGSKAAVDARLTQVRVTAAEITGGVPAREARGGAGWWVTGLGCSAAAVALLAVRRRRRGQWPWSDGD